jgi:uncharacterized protein involved in exopolysaccharide biosynthesis
MPRNRESLINSEIEILRSQEVIVRVISAMGVERLYPGLAESSTPEGRRLGHAIRSFSAGLSAQAVRGTDVIRVSFQHPDPQTAAESVNLLVESFKEKHLEAFSEPQTAEFLEEKVASYREKLQVSEHRLKAFQAEHEAFALAEPDSYLLQQRTELKDRLREIHAQMTTVRQQYAQEDPAIAKGKMRLLELQLKEQDLKAGIGGTSRDLVDVRKKIDLVESFLESRRVEVERGEKKELGLLEEQRADTETRLAGLESELKGLSQLSTQFRQLSRDLEVNERNYGNFAAKAEEARLSDEMDREKIANISVIQAAVAPLDPVRPRRLLNLAVGLLVGGALGLVTPYLLASSSSKTA